MTITLYYAPMSNAGRIQASLAELGLEHEKVLVNFRSGEPKTPEFMALNPNGMVPTIVIDGTPMFESVAIQIALGERYGVEKKLWPALGSPEHLKALTWLIWGQVTLGTAVMRYMHNTASFVPKELHHAGQAEAAMTEIHKRLAILDAHLGTSAFLAGDTFTLADLDVAAVLGWAAHVAKFDLSKYPKLGAWLGSIGQRPSMRAGME